MIFYMWELIVGTIDNMIAKTKDKQVQERLTAALKENKDVSVKCLGCGGWWTLHTDCTRVKCFVCGGTLQRMEGKQ